MDRTFSSSALLSWEEQRRAAGEVAQAARGSEAAGIIVCGVPSPKHADKRPKQPVFVGSCRSSVGVQEARRNPQQISHTSHAIYRMTTGLAP